ncbi:hypothetical protein VPHF89G1_0011 [Vibrio phage F89 g1]
MSNDITEGIKIPNGVFVELRVGPELVYIVDVESGEIYEVWRAH